MGPLAQALGREGEWMTRKEAAVFLTKLGCPVSPGTLRNMARKNNQGHGPAFHRSGWRTVRYKTSDLRVWAENKVERVE